MTVKEYLHQAYRLDQRIKSDTMEAHPKHKNLPDEWSRHLRSWNTT